MSYPTFINFSSYVTLFFCLLKTIALISIISNETYVMYEVILMWKIIVFFTARGPIRYRNVRYAS